MDNSRRYGKIQQQDYDDLLATAERSFLFCLSERTAKMLLAFTDPLHWTTRYFSLTNATIDAVTVNNWADTVESELISNMNNCCCGDVPFGARIRWTAEGVLQISYDDGETWIDYPEGDERRNVPEYPPLTPPEGTTDKCYAAQNITGNVHQAFDAWIVQLATVATVAVAVDGLAGIVAIFTGGISLPVAAIIAGVAEAFSLGATAIDDAWSDEAYRALFCCCLEHIPDSGIIDAAAMENIRECFRDEVGGLAADLLDVLQILEGTTAFANMAKVPADSGFDCEECDDVPDLIFDWHYDNPPASTITQIDTTTWEVTSAERSPGEQALGFKDALDRCVGIVTVLSGGAGTFQYNTLCDNSEGSAFGDVTGSEAKRFQWTRAAGSPFTMQFTVVLV